VTPGVEDKGTLEVEDEGMLEVVVDAWGRGLGTTAFGTSVGFPTSEPEGMGCANIFSNRLSYTKLSVLAKNGASPDAILWTCSVSSFGSFPVKFLWRNWISMSITTL